MGIGAHYQVSICAGCNQFKYWGRRIRHFVLSLLFGHSGDCDKLKGFYTFTFITNDIQLHFHVQVDDVVDGIAIQLDGGYVGLLISVPLFKDDG